MQMWVLSALLYTFYIDTCTDVLNLGFFFLFFTCLDRLRQLLRPANAFARVHLHVFVGRVV